jgi:hypothetical protein
MGYLAYVKKIEADKIEESYGYGAYIDEQTDRAE